MSPLCPLVIKRSVICPDPNNVNIIPKIPNPTCIDLNKILFLSEAPKSRNPMKNIAIPTNVVSSFQLENTPIPIPTNPNSIKEAPRSAKNQYIT